MDFKYVKLPDDHGLDEQHLKFLGMLDNALTGMTDGFSAKKDLDAIKADMDKQVTEMKTQFNYEKMQEQINEVFVRLEKSSKIGRTDKEIKTKELDLNNQWIRAWLRKDMTKMGKVDLELKTWPSHVLHTGDNVNIDGGSDAQGGVLIPELFMTEVNRYVETFGIARRDMRYLPFSGSGNERKIPTLLTNVTVGWIDEAEAKPKTKPTFAIVTQTLKVLAAMVIMTEEILEDSAINLVALCSELIGTAIAEEEDRSFLAGRIAGGDVWNGVLYAAGTVSVNMAVGDGAADITPETLLAMTLAIQNAAVIGSSFYMHRETFSLIRAYRADAVVADDRRGNYLVEEPTGTTPGRIWGFPVVLSEVLPAASDVTGNLTPFLFFANLGRTCVYGDKQGIRVKLLDQATVTDSTGTLINLAERDMLALRIHKRVGYVPVLPAGIAVLRTGARS